MDALHSAALAFVWGCALGILFMQLTTRAR